MTALAALAAHLKVPTERLVALEGHGEERVADLDGIIREAFEAEDRAFDAGLEEALRFIPKMLRPVAKKILFGGTDG